MEQPIKQFYEAPSTTVFEVRQEGIICASGYSVKGNTGSDSSTYPYIVSED